MNKPEEIEDMTKMISFIQYDLPGLTAGDYEIEVSQNITNASGKLNNEDIKTTSKFHVNGDKFFISNPGETIYSLFPAENASGKFSNSFPHIVFKKSTFPWIRIPEKKVVARGKNDDYPVWVALLLLDQDELDETKKVNMSVVTIRDLYPCSAATGSSLNDNYSYFHNKNLTTPLTDSKLSEPLDAGMKLTDLVSVLDIKVSLFKYLAPSLADLKVLGHVRKVSLVQKATMKGISDKGVDSGKFSIVFGNRLPSVNKKNTVFLVSLEGLEDFLPGSTSSNIDQKKTLRLAVLNSWSFFTNDQDGKFIDLVSRLNNAPGGFVNIGGKDVANSALNLTTTLKYPAPEKATKVVKEILNRGYVPMNHDLRVKLNKTVSWYRGPLVPCEVTNRLEHWSNNFANRSWATSADELMIFDPSTGMIDISYAVGWRLGKQLALQNKKTTNLIFNWTNNICKDMRLRLENKEMYAKMNSKSSNSFKNYETNAFEVAISSLILNIDQDDKK